MAKVDVNGVALHYEEQGSGPPLLLIMGVGGQLTDWPQPFVDLLSREFRVVRFDNRDSGLSSDDTAPVPTRRQIALASTLPRFVNPSYTLDDLADDAFGLIASLDLGPTHVVGMSMGAMVAQLVAIRHRSSVRSLCSIMGSTGDRRSGLPTIRVLAHLARRGQPDRANALQASLNLFALVGGPDWDRDEQRRRSAASIERAYKPGGLLRQALAIAASGNRTAQLAAIDAPTLVIHGLDDVLVRPSGGVATARANPNSQLLLFPRMGHDLPATRHAAIVDAIARNASFAPTLAWPSSM